MSARPLRWQGPTRADACRVEMERLLSQWRQAWGIDGDVGLAAVDPGVLPSEADWRGAGRDGAHYWLLAPPEDAQRLGAALAGQGIPDAMGLAAGLAKRALDDLLQRLLPASPGAVQWLATPAAPVFSARHGSLALSLTGVLQDYVVLLDAGACDRLIPRPGPAPCRISPKLDALRAQSLVLEALMPLGEHGVAQALTLQVGDVLLAGPLNAPNVRMTTAAGDVVTRGVLTRAGELRGLRVDQNNLSVGDRK